MSWSVVKEHVDKQIGHHIIHMQEAWSKAEHIVQIIIGKDSCPLCGHVWPKTNTGELDPRAIKAAELASLELVHKNMDAYAKKNSIAIRKVR